MWPLKTTTTTAAATTTTTTPEKMEDGRKLLARFENAPIIEKLKTMDIDRYHNRGLLPLHNVQPRPQGPPREKPPTQIICRELLTRRTLGKRLVMMSTTTIRMLLAAMESGAHYLQEYGRVFKSFNRKRLKCVLLVHFNHINQNRFSLKRLFPIEHDHRSLVWL